MEKRIACSYSIVNDLGDVIFGRNNEYKIIGFYELGFALAV